MTKVPRYIRIIIMVVALAWLSGVLGPHMSDGLWLLLPILYWETFILARWLFFRLRWRRVKATVELDDIDKEWELYNQ